MEQCPECGSTYGELPRASLASTIDDVGRRISSRLTAGQWSRPLIYNVPESHHLADIEWILRAR